MRVAFLNLRSLKVRVIAATVIVFLVGVGLFASYSVRLMRADMVAVLGEQQFSTASLLAATVNQEVRHRLGALEDIAGRISPDMMVEVASLQAALENRPILQSLFNGGVMVVSLDGTTIADVPLPAKRVGVSYLDRDYIVRTLKEGKTTIGPPVRGKVLPAPVFGMAAPILDSQAKVIGALVGVTDLGRPNFLSEISEGRYGQTGGYFVISRQHRLIVTASDKTRIMESLPAPGVIPTVDARINGSEGWDVFVNSKGVELLTAAKGIPAANWYLAVALPTEEVFAPVRAMQQRMLLSAALFGLLAGGVISWLLRWLLRHQLAPMIGVTRMLTAMSATDPIPHQLPVAEKDEVGELIGGFNRLLEILAKQNAELRRGESRFRSIIEASPIPYAMNDERQNITYLNSAFIRTFGYTREDIPTLADWWPRAYPDPHYRQWVADTWQKSLDEATRTGELFVPMEVSITSKNDGVRTCLVSAAALPDDLSATHLVIFYDITERNQLKLELSEKERHFAAIVETAPVGVFETDREGRCIFVNSNWSILTGFSPEAAKGDGWSSTLHPEDRAKVYAEWTAAVAEGRHFHLEYRFLNPDGRVVWVLGQSNRYCSATGKLLGYIGTVTDITERKRVEANLLLLGEITAHAAEGVSLVGASDGAFIYTNHRFNEIFGYAEGELIGKPVTIINAPGDASPQQTMSMIVSALESTGFWHGEVLNVRKDGTVFWTSANVSKFHHAEFGTVWITHQSDITDRKNAETELHELNERLEIRIEERTRELVRAKEAAEAANIAKSAFLANMSHEIRTPMNGIVGMANILRREGVTPKQAQRLDTIDASAQHLLSIINDILDLSKIEAGKFILEEAPVALGSLLANVSSILSERAAAKGIRLLVQTEPQPYGLMGDPTRLQQALLNYATNAIKFTETGQVILRTLLQEEAANEVVVRFEVEDTGIGISPEAMSRLFSAFEQADNSMTRKYGGTGLGLAITRRLAELMGGQAGARSTPGVGSTFWFTVKLKKSAAVAVKHPQADLDAETVIRQHYAGNRILVADDEPINREVAQMQLEAVGLVVDIVEDGAKAVTLAQETAYAAIFMDMQMPNVNGLEATQQIRRLPGYRHTPIIAMTANAFAEDKAHCFEAGMSDFLIKPFNPDDMFTILLRALMRRDH